MKELLLTEALGARRGRHVRRTQEQAHLRQITASESFRAQAEASEVAKGHDNPHARVWGAREVGGRQAGVRNLGATYHETVALGCAP